MTKRKDPKDYVKRGRPTKYTEALAKEICDVFAVTYCDLEKLCDERDNWPSARTIYDWIHKIPGFSQLYTRAQKARTEVQTNYVLREVLDNSEDLIMGKHGLMPNSARVQRSNIRAAHIMKLVSVMNREKYGDVKKTEITGANGGPIEYNEHVKKLSDDQLKREIEELVTNNR